jgi:hypothetical protein
MTTTFESLGFDSDQRGHLGASEALVADHNDIAREELEGSCKDVSRALVNQAICCYVGSGIRGET